MNLTQVRDRTPNEVTELIDEEIGKISRPEIVEGLKTFLMTPRMEMRTWDWQKPLTQYPVWLVATSKKFDYGIVFSDYGFGPERPWGLVFLSHSNFDADYCWYPNLEEAYEESRLIEEFEGNL